MTAPSEGFEVGEVVRFGFSRGEILSFERCRYGQCAVVRPLAPFGNGDGYGTKTVPVSSLRKADA